MGLLSKRTKGSLTDDEAKGEEMYRIYGFELSYFTRKLEVALTMSGRPLERRPKSILMKRSLEHHSGTHQVPVMVTPDGRYLSDTTPIIEEFGDLGGGRHLFPEGEDGVLVRVIEEWLDEWFPRTVIHYRWNFEESARWASGRIAREVMPHVFRPMRPFARRSVAQWGHRAARALAVDSPAGHAGAERVTRRVLGALETQLKHTSFALGDRPTAVDAVLLGAMRAHLAADPVPRRVIEEYPEVFAWAQAPVHVPDSGELCTFRAPNHFARTILNEWPTECGQFLAKNRAALMASTRVVPMCLEGTELTMLARPYTEWSRQHLVRWFNAQDSDLRASIGPWLEDTGLSDALTIDLDAV